MSETTKEKDKHESMIEETNERAELLYKYQVVQYELAVNSIRRLEDKATKILSILSIVITVTLLIIRYWWADLFESTGLYTPQQVLCWIFLFAFMFFSMCSWGYTFSVMVPKEFAKPPSSLAVTDHFVDNPRYKTMTDCANSYSACTDIVDSLHSEKVKMIGHCTESMLFGAWSFLLFLIFFLILKLTH